MKYPVIVLREKDTMIYVVPDEKTHTTTTREGLKRRRNIKDTIIDSTGRVYEAYGAEEIGWAAPFWGFNPMRRGRAIKIKLLIDDKASVITFKELQDLVCARIDQAPQHWEGKEHPEELKRILRESSSYQEIMEVLS
jgi:hypothetical protein